MNTAPIRISLGPRRLSHRPFDLVLLTTTVGTRRRTMAPKATNIRPSPASWITWLVVSLAFLNTGSSSGQAFQIDQIKVHPSGALSITHPANSNSYYILYQGSFGSITNPASVALGETAINGELEHISAAGPSNQQFFRARAVPIISPLDVDADGIDDVYELKSSSVLNPFNPLDSNNLSPVAGKTYLKAYNEQLKASWPRWTRDVKSRFSVHYAQAYLIEDNGSAWRMGSGGVFGERAWYSQNPGSDWAAVSAFPSALGAVVFLKNNGTLWNKTSSGFAQLGSDTDWLSISAGFSHNVGLKADGSIWGWGQNSLGGLGSAPSSVPVPVQIRAANGWAAVYAAGTSTYALKSDGTLWRIFFSTLTRIGTTNFAKVFPGGRHSLALGIDGRLWAWGANESGQLGDGTTAARSNPVLVGADTNWITAACGDAHSVAIKRDGSLWAWGRPSSLAGQLNNQTLSPSRIGSDSDWTETQAGYEITLALKRDGSIWYWGEKLFGVPVLQLFQSNSAPARLGIDEDWKSVDDSGSGNKAALTRDGKVWTWGNNQWGQLGDGTTSNRLAPVMVNSGLHFAAVRAGGGFTIAKTGSSVRIWGDISRVLGFGSYYADQLSPAEINPAFWPGGASTAAHGGHNLQILPTDDPVLLTNVLSGENPYPVSTNEGVLYSWGGNSHGQLGDGTTNSRLITAPEEVTNAWRISVDWKAVGIGESYSVAVRQSNRTYVWGSILEFLGAATQNLISKTPVSIDSRFWLDTTNWPLDPHPTAWVSGGRLYSSGTTVGDGSSDESSDALPIVTLPVSRPFHIGSLPKASLAVDANRDGYVSFDESDATSEDNPYRFWANNDRDQLKLTSLPWPDDNYYEEDDADTGPTDCSDKKITTLRDLEDFFRVHLKLDGNFFSFPSSVIRIEFALTSSSPGQAVNIYRAADQYGGTGFLENVTEAQAQTNRPYGEALGTITHGTPLVLRGDQIPELFSANAKACFLVEAINSGSMARLSVKVSAGDDDVTSNDVWLKIDDITTWYEAWSVGETEGVLPAPVAVRESIFHYPAPATDEEKDYVLFVYGWNVEPNTKRRWAETIYKRLWHQGYKGRLGLFVWPCLVESYWDKGKTFNPSEFVAWNSAQGLLSCLDQISAEGHAGRIRLLAHSQGNIIAGEALRLAAHRPVVHTYVATQAAIPAHAYDASLPDISGTWLTINVYSRYWEEGQFNYVPAAWYGALRSYCHPDYMRGSAGTFVNFFNVQDYALALWRDNQYYTKPIRVLYSYETPLGFRRLHSLDPGSDSLGFPDDRYEIFSKAAQGRSQPLGAQAGVGGVFAGHEVDLQAEFGFTNEHKYHSGEFRMSAAAMHDYWKKFLEVTALKPPD